MVDTAHMLCLQDMLFPPLQLDAGPIVYGMLDSSPQHGRDYELAALTVVLASDMEGVFRTQDEDAARRGVVRPLAWCGSPCPWLWRPRPAVCCVRTLPWQ